VKFAIRGAYSRLYEVSGPAERWGARMADSARGWLPFSADGLQILGGDPVAGIVAERALEATSCVVGLSEPGSSGTEVGLLVSRLQVSRQMDHSPESKRAAPSPARPTASGKGQRPERA